MVCVVALRNHSVVSWSFTSRQACIGADSHELDGHLARVAANCMSFLGCKNCPTSNPSYKCNPRVRQDASFKITETAIRFRYWVLALITQALHGTHDVHDRTFSHICRFNDSGNSLH
eukprot:TRINITY_DN12643_c0_g1_i7.p1 TRINITY_DN12643_c0_g1~~TRINITY_DN12643_c0_g1_i7.p1  ORF type:complete len:117 (-),score=9.84 TRINITY_DN12643_c0_g1_i7:198-548(-)